MQTSLDFRNSENSFFRSLRQKPRPGGQINYREEEKRILDSILGRDVYDNRIRPSGLNGTGNYHIHDFINIFICKLFSDAATIISVNLYIRSFAKIDDVKMVSLFARDLIFLRKNVS